MLCKIPPGEVPCHCHYKFSPNCTTSKAAYWLWSLRRSSCGHRLPALRHLPQDLYKYRHQAEQGSLASFDCTPRVHGFAKPPDTIAAVLRAKAQYPSFGKQRLANVLSHQGVLISPNTVQRICESMLQLCHRSHACDAAGTPLKRWRLTSCGPWISVISIPASAMALIGI